MDHNRREKREEKILFREKKKNEKMYLKENTKKEKIMWKADKKVRKPRANLKKIIEEDLSTIDHLTPTLDAHSHLNSEQFHTTESKRVCLLRDLFDLFILA